MRSIPSGRVSPVARERSITFLSRADRESGDSTGIEALEAGDRSVNGGTTGDVPCVKWGGVGEKGALWGESY
jgi:hypothetical protein